MLKTIKATLFRLCDMSWSSLVELKQWMKCSRSFNDFDAENFNNPSLRVAQATTATGETVAYAPVETIFLVRAFAVNPSATPADKQRAGDYLDQEIVRQAQRQGVSLLLMVVPDDQESQPDEKWIRIVERKVAQIVTHIN